MYVFATFRYAGPVKLNAGLNKGISHGFSY